MKNGIRISVILLLILLGNIPEVSAQDSPQEESQPTGFCWGADINSSIDLTGNAMTNVSFDAVFGYKSRYIRLAGVGASVNMMMSNSSTAFPIFAVLRTNFLPRPTLCFLDLRGGVSLNRIHNFNRQTGGYGQLGLGFNLSQGKNFATHIIVAYSFLSRKDFELDGGIYRCPWLHFATFSLGINF